VDTRGLGLSPFHFPNLGRGSGAEPPADGRPGVSPSENFWNSVCDLVHFCAIWWQLFVGRQTRYICNFAIKMEPICQIQCPHDCTAVLSLLSNEHALKSGTFSVPGMVLSGCGTTWHKFGTSREILDGWQPCRGQFPVLFTWTCLTVPPPSVTIPFRHFGLFWIC